VCQSLHSVLSELARILPTVTAVVEKDGSAAADHDDDELLSNRDADSV
jgi:hypothetical protein